MGMYGKRHASAALSRGNRPPYSSGKILNELQGKSGQQERLGISDHS